MEELSIIKVEKVYVIVGKNIIILYRNGKMEEKWLNHYNQLKYLLLIVKINQKF